MDVPVKKPGARSPGDLLRFADGSEAKVIDGMKSSHLAPVHSEGWRSTNQVNKVVDQRLSTQGIT